MTKYTTYRRFFTWLKHACVVHADLVHEDVAGRKVFFERNVERADAFTSDEVSANGYCVVAMYPDAERSNQNGVMSNTLLVFIGKQSNTANNADAIAEAMNDTYQIWLDFLNKLNKDEETNRIFLGSGALSNFGRATAQENFYEGYSGWLWQFNLAHQFNACDLSKFNDGGVTNINVFD